MIKAIETVYNGYRFRSRLEARWAVFFDTLGVKYEYEKEGYELGDVTHESLGIVKGCWYLPDFWLPEHQCFVEIKPQEPTQEERHKALLLSLFSGNNVHIFVGDVWIPDFAELQNEVYMGPGMDYCHVWCECPYCHKVGLQFEGRAARLCDCEERIEGTVSGKGYNSESTRLVAAYTAARQARFERGQQS